MWGKKQVITTDDKLIAYVKMYYEELRKEYSKEDILIYFKKKKYPPEVIKYFNDYDERRDKMVKPKDEDFDDDDLDEDDLDDEDIDEKPKKTVKKDIKPAIKEELTKADLINAISQLAVRVNNLEAWCQRVRSQ